MLAIALTASLFAISVSALQPPHHRLPRATSGQSLNKKWNATNVDQLKRDLLLNYDKFARPSHSTNATSILFDPSINHIEVDEDKSIMTIHCWIKMKWKDEKLKWDPDDYGGLTELRLADHEVWQPDVTAYNSAAGSTIDHFANTHSVVTSDGTVLWVPSAIIQVFCELDMRKWPFDTQSCPLKVGSWTYSGFEIDLHFSPEEPEIANLVANAEWQYVSIERKRSETHYACCVEPYVDLVFTITVSRNADTYKAIIITPLTAIVLMTLATFWLPSQSGDKIFLGGTTILTISVYLLYFSQKLGVMAGHTPLVVLFYTSSMYLVSLSVVISVIVINLSATPKSTAVPWFIKQHLNGRLGKLLLLDYISPQTSFHSRPKIVETEETDDNRPMFAAEGQDLPEGQGTASSRVIPNHDWLILAAAIDRVAFILYSFLFVIFAIAFAV